MSPAQIRRIANGICREADRLHVAGVAADDALARLTTMNAGPAIPDDEVRRLVGKIWGVADLAKTPRNPAWIIHASQLIGLAADAWEKGISSIEIEKELRRHAAPHLQSGIPFVVRRICGAVGGRA